MITNPRTLIRYLLVMKWAARLTLATALLVTLGACTPDAGPTTTANRPQPSSTTQASIPLTTTGPQADPTVPQTDSNGAFVGSLLDGSPYAVTIEPLRTGETIDGVSAVIAVELGDTSAFLDVTLEPQTIEGAVWEGDAYLVPVGDWTVRIAGVSPDERELRQAVESVEGWVSSGLPVLDLKPPLRWASDIEHETVMEVRYSTFSVRRGCRTLAAICSEQHAVQLSNVEPTDEDLFWIESHSQRPEADAWFIDPGPLSPRGGHQVMWTGDEMIVWGGSTADTPPNLIDGAAFDPATTTWRMLAPIPDETSQLNVAVWAGDQMIVVSASSTMSYDPDTDEWRAIGDGAALSSETQVQWTGTRLALWTTEGISLFDPRDGAWEELPDPGFGGPSQWEGALRSARTALIAVGLDTPDCSGRLAAKWNGTDWERLPKVDLATAEYADCGYPNQTAVIDGYLVYWTDNNHPTMALNLLTEELMKIDTIPLSGAESPSGPIEVGSGVLVPQWGEAAWLPSVDASWVSLDMPGQGRGAEMIWTGDEVLMWAAACCYGSSNTQFTVDAWRWTMLGP